MSSPSAYRKTKQADLEELVGSITKVVRTFDSNIGQPAMSICNFKPKHALGEVSIKMRHDVGMTELIPGNIPKKMVLRLIGRWSSYKPKHKFAKEMQQFVVESAMEDIPLDESSFVWFIERMVTEATEGLKVSHLKKIWKKYGDESLEMLRDRPTEIAIMFEKEIEKATAIFEILSQEIKSSASMSRTTLEVATLLQGYGFHRNVATDAVRIFGTKAIERIRRNPFCLMEQEIPSAGFKRCDQMYCDMGLNQNRLRRICYAVQSSIKNGVNGSCWFSRAQLEKEAATIVSANSKRISRAIEFGLRAGILESEFTNGPRGDICQPSHGVFEWIAPRSLAKAESAVAAAVAEVLHDHRRCWQIQDKPFFGISQHQHDALRVALSKGIGILTGGPGTGKTRTVASLLAWAAMKDTKSPASGGYFDVKVMAPTGKAVTRSREAFRAMLASIKPATTPGKSYVNVDFSTCHAAVLPTFETSDEEQLIVIEEPSMLDVEMFAAILAKYRYAKFLLVGDDGQLPPVGPGHPLRDLKDYGVPIGKLTDTHRSSGGVISICQSIRNKRPWNPHGNVTLDHCPDPEKIPDSILQRFTVLMAVGSYNPLRDIQVITAVNEKGPCSKAILNELLQREFNSNGQGMEGVPFRVGDKVICRKNQSYQTFGGGGAASVCNGDQGIARKIDRAGMMVELSDGVQIAVPWTDSAEGNRSYHKNARCSWELGYAISCHSSQGSEWPIVIVALDPSNSAYGVCSAEWLTVAISRLQTECYLVGTMETAQKFCQRSAVRGIQTLLPQRIRAEVNRQMVESL